MKKLTLIISLLSVLAITNAQNDENIILNTDVVQKNELRVTPEITEMLVNPIYSIFIDKDEKKLSNYGIKNRSQLENLHLGKPIPWYRIENENLTFTGFWNVPIMSDGEPLLFEIATFTDIGKYSFIDIGIANIIEYIHNYEHKDLILGSLGVTPLGKGMDFLIIRKENKDIFVQVYDEVTREYCKNEYSFSELGNLLKELDLRAKIKAQSRPYGIDSAQLAAHKRELTVTPELAEKVFTRFQNMSEKFYSNYGIKNRSQLTNLELGKPIPKYVLKNDTLDFTGRWEVLVLSDGVPFFKATIKLTDDGQYEYAGGGAGMAEAIHNYEHKDLIIGFLGVRSPNGTDYLIIRKKDKDIFVKSYDWETREVFKTEYSLSDIINLTKE